jgi:hypothetical protein
VRHGKLGLHNANELVGRRRETIFATLLVAALACTDMACSKTGLVRNAFIDFPREISFLIFNPGMGVPTRAGISVVVFIF